MEPLCTQCGNDVVILRGMDDVTFASEPVQSLIATARELNPDVVINQEEFATQMCSTCNSTTFLGPRITVVGTVMEDPDAIG